MILCEKMSDVEIPGVDVQIEVKTERLLDEELRVSSEVMRATLGGAGVDEGYCCLACGKVYKTVTTLNCHRQLKHPAVGASAQCTLCDKLYSSLVSLHKHTQYKHRNKSRCDTCYRNFETEVELTEHQQYCRKSAVECPHCSKVYASQVSLRNHVKYKHPASSEHWCEPCRRSFGSARGLANHAAALHAPASTECRPCARAFPSAAALRSHNLYRHSAGTARCRLCCKLFATATSLAKHAAKKHNNGQGCAACYSSSGNKADVDKHDSDDYILSDLPK